jgi:hypothetical protein
MFKLAVFCVYKKLILPSYNYHNNNTTIINKNIYIKNFNYKYKYDQYNNKFY